MTTLFLLAAIFIDRIAPQIETYRRFDWLTRYSSFIQSLLPETLLVDNPKLIVILLVPVLLLVALIQSTIGSGAIGFGSVIFATAALLASLGPKDIDREITRYWEADSENDSAEQQEIARALIQGDVPQDENAREAAIASAILWQANNRFFAVIFWFVVLGPFGAIFYRLTSEYVRIATQGHPAATVIQQTATHLLDILDWLPARLTAVLYGLAGSLEEAVEHWKHLLNTHDGKPSSQAILVAVGLGALRQDTLDPMAEMDASLALVWRAAIFMLSALILFSLVSWLT